MTSKQTTRLGKAPEEGIKAPVVVATFKNIALSGLPIISSVQLAEGDRVLVKNQTNAVDNGIYCAFIGTWDRAKDWNKNNDVVNGQLVVDANTRVIWSTVIPADFDINVSDVSFTYTDLAGAAAYIHKTGGNNTMLQLLDMNDQYIKDGKVKTDEIIEVEDIVNLEFVAELIDKRLSGEDSKDYGRTDMVIGPQEDNGLVTDVTTEFIDYGSI